MKKLIIISGIILVLVAARFESAGQIPAEQFINGDALPDAPELALRGEYKIGVRTLEIIHKNQIDILKSKGGTELLYDRTLKLEIWYPAIVSSETSDIIVWPGFKARTSVGLELLHSTPVK